VEFSVEVNYDAAIDEELFVLSDNSDIYTIPNGGALFWGDEYLILVYEVFRISNRLKKLSLWK
jgi:hypothetical protein